MWKNILRNAPERLLPRTSANKIRQLLGIPDKEKINPWPDGFTASFTVTEVDTQISSATRVLIN